MSKLALKRLTASDLTFFEWHFRNRNAGNQKGINLNADVFVSKLYPALPEIAPRLDGRLPVDLFVFGPNAAPELNLQRKIIKTSSYKNWRLNGEFISNPIESTTRFNDLVEGDIAVLEFNDGEIPTRARVVLLARSSNADSTLHGFLNTRLGTSSMVALHQADLVRDMSAAKVSADHPINELALERDLEDAAQGGAIGSRRLRSRRSGRKVFRSELLQAKRQAEENGLLGEEFVNGLLLDSQENGKIRSFVWVSSENAVAAYDFRVEDLTGSSSNLDVKATTGEFDRPIHVSLAELEEIAASDTYAIYRVYAMTDETARLRVATGTRSIAAAILKSLSALPEGVVADSVTIRPESLKFGPESVIRRRREEAGD